ncbi:hypothetical protein CIB48_g8176 [Xylaria polymorpha]|nr:hypothetical protein CIB48_g8176 [Xylaria polymorpha]
MRERYLYLLGTTVIFPRRARCVHQEAEQTLECWWVLGSERHGPRYNAKLRSPFNRSNLGTRPPVNLGHYFRDSNRWSGRPIPAIGILLCDRSDLMQHDRSQNSKVVMTYLTPDSQTSKLSRDVDENMLQARSPNYPPPRLDIEASTNVQIALDPEQLTQSHPVLTGVEQPGPSVAQTMPFEPRRVPRIRQRTICCFNHQSAVPLLHNHGARPRNSSEDPTQSRSLCPSASRSGIVLQSIPMSVIELPPGDTAPWELKSVYGGYQNDCFSGLEPNVPMRPRKDGHT